MNQDQPRGRPRLMKEAVNVAVSSPTQMVEHERLGKGTCWTICQHLFGGGFAWTGRLQPDTGSRRENINNENSASVPHSCKVDGPGWVRENTTRSSAGHGGHDLHVYWKESARWFSAVLDNIQPPSQRWSGLSRSLFSEIRLD